MHQEIAFNFAWVTVLHVGSFLHESKKKLEKKYRLKKLKEKLIKNQRDKKRFCPRVSVTVIVNIKSIEQSKKKINNKFNDKLLTEI